MSSPLERALKTRSPGEPVGLSLGAMNFGKRTPEREAEVILARAVERGVVHLDTANAYNDGASERIVGAFVKKNGLRDRVVLATKCGFGRNAGKPEGLSPERLVAACDESLARLDTDVVDVYYLHVPDHGTPIERTLDGVQALLEAKKIRAWGVSNYASWQILEMIHLADARNMPKPRIAQQLYNALIRQLDVEYFAFARKYGVHTTVYNPLAGGLLTGKHERDGSTQKGTRFDKNTFYQERYFTDVMFDHVDALKAVANEEGLSLLELAYAFVAGTAGVDSILLGPATVAQLDQGIDACQKSLSPEARSTLDALHRDWLGTKTNYVR